MIKFLSIEGLKGIMCIDPHSNKVVEKGKEYGITINNIDPFQSSSHINPYKLNLNSTAEEILSQLQPFLKYLNKVKDKKFKDKKFIFISLDDGTERRTEQFLINSGLSWDHLMYLSKLRDNMDKPIFSIKNFSRINENNLEKDAIYVLIDDMIDSGGSADGVAKSLKEKDVEHVELWITHPLAPVREKVIDLKYIDKIVALDTILHDNPEELNIEYLNASSHLLSAEIFKTHMRLEEERLNV